LDREAARLLLAEAAEQLGDLAVIAGTAEEQGRGV
jgi:hypothetical protein